MKYCKEHYIENAEKYMTINEDQCVITCDLCGESRSFPQYARDFPNEVIKNYYFHPLSDFVKANHKQKMLRSIEEMFKISFYRTLYGTQKTHSKTERIETAM